MSDVAFVFKKDDFCVPVTKMEPTESIQFIIDDFIKKEITFCVYYENDKCEIWRLVEDNDCAKIKKENEYAKPDRLYIKGTEICDFVFKS